MQVPCQWKSIRNRSLRHLPRCQCPNAISALLKNGHIMWRRAIARLFKILGALCIGARIAEVTSISDVYEGADCRYGGQQQIRPIGLVDPAKERAHGHLFVTIFVFKDIVAFKESPFVFNNIVALSISYCSQRGYLVSCFGIPLYYYIYSIRV